MNLLRVTLQFSKSQTEPGKCGNITRKNGEEQGKIVLELTFNEDLNSNGDERDKCSV